MNTFWITASDWVIVHEQWITSLFSSLNSDFINKVITNSYRTVLRVSKQLRGKKEYTFAAAGLLKQKVRISFNGCADSQIEQFRNYVPIISKLRHPGIRQRHWEMIAKDVGFKSNFLILCVTH
jgi:dynein heavy chain